MFPDKTNAIQQRFGNPDHRFVVVHPSRSCGKRLEQVGILADRDPGRLNEQMPQRAVVPAGQALLDFVLICTGGRGNQSDVGCQLIERGEAIHGHQFRIERDRQHTPDAWHRHHAADGRLMFFLATIPPSAATGQISLTNAVSPDAREASRQRSADVL